MSYTYMDIVNRVRQISRRWDEDSLPTGAIATLIDSAVRQVYQFLNSYGHPYVLGTTTLTVTSTFTDLPGDVSRVLRIEGNDGRKIFRRHETAGQRREYEVVGTGRVRWYPPFNSTATLTLYYVKKLNEPSSLTATVTAPESAYDFILKYTLGYVTRDPLALEGSRLAWEQFVNVAYDECEVPRVLKRGMEL